MLQTKAETMLNSWGQIKKHAEVVKFAVGLEGNQKTKQGTKQSTDESTNESRIQNTGSALVSHVYRMFTGNILQDMRNGENLALTGPELSLLIDIVHEMKSRIETINEDSNKDDDQTNTEDGINLFDPYRNRHFYYVTKLPLEIESTMYFFGRNGIPQGIHSDNWIGNQNIMQNITEPCAVVIDSPCLKEQQVLEAVSNLKQSITDLFIRNPKSENSNEDATFKRMMTDLIIRGSQPDQSDPFKRKDRLFQIDRHAKSIRIYENSYNLPSNVQTDLGRQIALCKELQCLRIPQQPFIVNEMAHNLGQNVGLMYLDVHECNLPHRRIPPVGFPNMHPLPLVNPANFATPLSMRAASGLHGSLGLFGGQSNFQGDCDSTGACGLSEDLCSILCQELKFMVELKELNLSENPLGTKSAHHLAESIRSWGSDSALEILKLSGCQMQQCGDLLEALASCRKMVILDLSGNNLNVPRDGEKLAQSIKSWKQKPPLVTLNLNGCGLKHSPYLMEALQTCENLRILELSNNVIGAEGSRNLARSIRSLGHYRQLHQLYVNNCQLDPYGCAELLNSLSACPELITLNISGNAIGGGFQALNPQSVFQRLIELEMNSTSLTEQDVQILGTIISTGGMPRLFSFALCGCQINSSSATHLTVALSSCTSLKSLYLSNNPIGGALQHLSASKDPIGSDVIGQEEPLSPGSLPVYQQLRHLWLKDTSLYSSDIQALAALVTDRRMPNINTTVIGWNKLASEAAAIKEKMMSKQLNSFLTTFQKGPDAAMQELLGFLNLPDGEGVGVGDADEYQHLFADEPDEFLDAFASILHNVNQVEVMEADVTLDKWRIKRLIETEKNRRMNLNSEEP